MQLEITAKFDAEVFLRSINIQYDAEYPSRIGHYQPTAKSVPLIKSLLGPEQDRAFLLLRPMAQGNQLRRPICYIWLRIASMPLKHSLLLKTSWK